MDQSSLPGTKIVITYGPSCRDEAVLRKMIMSGATCIRLNTAHSRPEDLMELVGFRDRIYESDGICVAIMVDLKGPELRALTEKPQIIIENGKKYTLSGKGMKADISVAVDSVIPIIQKGDRVLFMDGKLIFSVVENIDGLCTILSENDGILKNNGRMNIPGRYVPLGILQERDMEYLKLSVENRIDYIALSFVQERKEIDLVHDEILRMGGTCKIIAKIETKQAMDNLQHILRASDAMMVARGDLGVEMPINEVTLSQKLIIRKARASGIPTIVATQMLESMVENETPTRAEISDVTNAIIDGADSLMLSEESAIGKYPLKAVETLKDTALLVEKEFFSYSEPEEFSGSRITYSIARAAKVMSHEAKAHRILVLTRTGNTARMVCAVRPEVRVTAATPSRSVAGQMGILRGVRPVIIDIGKQRNISGIIDELQEKGAIMKWERIVVASGTEQFLFSGTSQLTVMTAGKMIIRGYTGGTKISGSINAGSMLVLPEGVGRLDDSMLKKYDIFVFRGEVERSSLEKIVSSGKTYFRNSIVMKEPGNDPIYIDWDLGAVYS